ncbi:MAG: hypothetical protein A3K04_02345 [Gallionellales bacterium RBG_16_56_9]|nr:MAG: hypothetical protein A3K04_02345 [Gallionellales bacterium RBG_16_56_9]
MNTEGKATIDQALSRVEFGNATARDAEILKAYIAQLEKEGAAWRNASAEFQKALALSTAPFEISFWLNAAKAEQQALAIERQRTGL